MFTALHNLKNWETQNPRQENGQVDFMTIKDILMEDMDYNPEQTYFCEVSCDTRFSSCQIYLSIYINSLINHT